jgi:hypothetical protein
MFVYLDIIYQRIKYGVSTIKRRIIDLVEEGHAFLQFINGQVYFVLRKINVIYLDYKPIPEVSNSSLEVL